VDIERNIQAEAKEDAEQSEKKTENAV